jgi:cytidyltransferase-like protein
MCNDVHVIVGRFQPLHTGHIDLIKEVINPCPGVYRDRVIIFIGSMNSPCSDKNPIRYLTRYNTIRGLLENMFPKGSKLVDPNNIRVMGLPDFKEIDPTGKTWARVLHDTVRNVFCLSKEESSSIAVHVSDKEEGAYTDLFLKEGLQVALHPVFEKGKYVEKGQRISSSIIREILSNNMHENTECIGGLGELLEKKDAYYWGSLKELATKIQFKEYMDMFKELIDYYKSENAHTKTNNKW